MDTVQFTKRDWRNRNLIKTATGPKWLTVPVETKGKFKQRIDEVKILNGFCPAEHLNILRSNYSGSKYFEEVFDLFHSALSNRHSYLSSLNEDLIRRVCDYLSINTRIRQASDFDVEREICPTKYLRDLCLAAGGSTYVTGPSAVDYLDEKIMSNSRLEIIYFKYPDYSEYEQLWGAFTSNLSIIDLLFNCGQTSKDKYKEEMSEKLVTTCYSRNH